MESSEQYYSRTWEISSLAYQELGFYEWCIGKINRGTHILEIGTGIGLATLALIKAGFIVSSLEENVYNFEKAKKNLLVLKRDINYLNSINEARQYFGKNNIILSNFITDWNEVVNVIKYDTVICWFVGVHPMAHMNPHLIELGYNKRNFGHYRSLIYNRIFQVISIRLEVGGIINLIERINILTSEQIEEERQSFDIDYDLERYGLTVEKIEQLPIGDISLIPGIETIPVEQGAIPLEEKVPNGTLTSYTIVKYKEVKLDV
ncbi:MAG TPA: hypothetical protein VI583_14810 [Cyclobacteriaceae bacterium]|nr:hypothetical protein [Cyclobacteriaceae bacterium]